MNKEIPERLYKHWAKLFNANPTETIFLIITRVREMIQTDGVAKTRSVLVSATQNRKPNEPKQTSELLIEILDDVYNGEEVGK